MTQDNKRDRTQNGQSENSSQVIEKAKRLAPTLDTLRELYLKSGNLCAFPGCGQVMMDAEGTFVGQICHIEAAEEGGERFNPAQSNEERRSFSNLMLMCYAHHQKTNDVTVYDVETLRRMKAEHEEKFSDPGRMIWKSITDESDALDLHPLLNIKKMDQVLGWGLGQKHLRESLEDFLGFFERLKQVPRRTREFLCIAVKRANRGSWGSGSEVAISELGEACRMTDRDMVPHVAILEKYGFAHAENRDEYDQALLTLSSLGDWPIWDDLLEFSKKTQVPVERLLVDLNMSALEG